MLPHEERRKEDRVRLSRHVVVMDGDSGGGGRAYGGTPAVHELDLESLVTFDVRIINDRNGESPARVTRSESKRGDDGGEVTTSVSSALIVYGVGAPDRERIGVGRLIIN